MVVEERSFIPIGNTLKEIYEEIAKHFSFPNEVFEEFLEASLDTAFITYLSVFHLITPNASYVLQANLLTRFLMEILFNLVFIIQDPERRIEWFGKVQFKNITEELLLTERKWFDATPESKKSLEELKENQAYLVTTFHVTPEEQQNLRKIDMWPTPYKMLKESERKKYWQGKTEKDLEFLLFILHHLYGQVSELTHGQVGALSYVIRIKHFPLSEQEKASTMTTPCMESAVFLLSIMSEIASIKKININNQLQKAWLLLSGYRNDIDELIELRYNHFVENSTEPT